MPNKAPGQDSTAEVASQMNPENARAFSEMLAQYDRKSQQTMMENIAMEKAQAFWNPLNTMSTRDSTC